MSASLQIEVRNQVLWLTINRPEKRNALNLALLDEIGETLARYAAATDIKLALLTGAGDKAFAQAATLRNSMPCARKQRRWLCHGGLAKRWIKYVISHYP
jgi:enoyl-CoA hydratase/carnithine racemase